mmetsp:Transcript_1463/g.2925  ORF Transcript_1463/g.2925 Transcript_1463/m.2925 type:complete len:208 (-) Transcript_1463:92-715(-)
MLPGDALPKALLRSRRVSTLFVCFQTLVFGIRRCRSFLPSLSLNPGLEILASLTVPLCLTLQRLSALIQVIHLEKKIIDAGVKTATRTLFLLQGLIKLLPSCLFPTTALISGAAIQSFFRRLTVIRAGSKTQLCKACSQLWMHCRKAVERTPAQKASAKFKQKSDHVCHELGHSAASRPNHFNCSSTHLNRKLFPLQPQIFRPGPQK